MASSRPPPIDPAGDPFAAGHKDQHPARGLRRAPDGGAPDTPGWTVRVVPNLYPALSADAPDARAVAKPDLFSARPRAAATR